MCESDTYGCLPTRNPRTTLAGALQQDLSGVIFVCFIFLVFIRASNQVGSRKWPIVFHRPPRGENPALARRETLYTRGRARGQVSSVRRRWTLSCKEGPHQRAKIRACRNSTGNHDSSKRVPKRRDKREGSGATMREGVCWRRKLLLNQRAGGTPLHSAHKNTHHHPHTGRESSLKPQKSRDRLPARVRSDHYDLYDLNVARIRLGKVPAS